MQLAHKKLIRAAALIIAGLGIAAVSGCSRPAASGVTVRNASYSPARKLYGDYNADFERYWKAKTGETVHVSMSYSKEGQEIIARNFYRPRDPQVAAQLAGQYPKIELATVSDLGGWATVQQKFFGDGGVLDQIYSWGQ